MTEPSIKPLKPGEKRLAHDPAAGPHIAGLVAIGRVQSAWTLDRRRPKNPREAREQGGTARIEIAPIYRAGLAGLAAFSHVWVLVWLDRAERTPIVIQPPHAETPSGVFALRSPVRPNPIGLTAARLVSVDETTGVIEIDAIDFLDGTPVIDVKPYRPGIDAMPDAVVG